MKCFRTKTPKTSTEPSKPNSPQPKTVKHETLLCFPGCKVHLMDEGEALELARGDFAILNLLDRDVVLATVVKVGEGLQWPLTKDEPVVKLGGGYYLFSLPMKDGEPLSYGVTFSEQSGAEDLGALDAFLREHSCFSEWESLARDKDVNWKEFAPRIEDYNNVLARAIAGGSGQIVKGIFMCSNAYTNQVQRGGKMILSQTAKEKNGVSEIRESKSNNNNITDAATKKTGIENNLKRVRKVTKMTESMSKAMLDAVGIASGSVMGPIVRSEAGKAFFAMVPGEILLASLDALNKVFDAVEVAEKQALSATSGAAKRMVSERYGESAGEATEDAFATAGNIAGTAWNIFKIRKAINPASSVPSGILKNAPKK